MNAIELTREHQFKLLEMCNTLFPEFENVEFGVNNKICKGWSNNYLLIDTNDSVGPEYIIHWLDEMCQKLNIDNPFKEFVLPEKWCVKNSPENSQVIRQWFEKETKRSPIDTKDDAYWHFPAIKSRCTTSMDKFKDYVEITFEQFEKYVLSKKKESQMNLEFTEFLNPTNSTLYRMLEQSDDHVFDTTGHSRSLDYVFEFYKVVEVVKHFNGKSETFRRGRVAQVINATSITKGVICDIFAENDKWYVDLKGHGKYLIEDVKITSVDEAIFTIDDIIKAFEQNGVSEQFTRSTLVKYFKG